ncbi:MAG: nucleotide exchange factor GrpE, partial [Candidatus Hodarchaeales archaeon]
SINRTILNTLDCHIAIIGNQLLEALQLEEIMTEKGMQLEIHLHKVLGTEPSELPKNTIIRTIRKGYALKKSKTTIRLSEVIVSSGEIQPPANSRNRNIKRLLTTIKAKIYH